MKEYYADQSAYGEFFISEEISELVDNKNKIENKLEDIFVEFIFDEVKLRKSLEKFTNNKKTKLTFVIDNKNLHYFLNNKNLSCILYYREKDILIINNSKFSFSFKVKKDNSRSCLAKVTFL